MKVEHPSRPDAARGHGHSQDGFGLWWKTLGRNKRTMTINLSSDAGAATMLRLLADADVLVEKLPPRHARAV